jgi:hypothetical protein
LDEDLNAEPCFIRIFNGFWIDFRQRGIIARQRHVSTSTISHHIGALNDLGGRPGIFPTRLNFRCATFQVGIDGYVEQPRGFSKSTQDQGLSERRVNAVRNALIQEGVPAHRIQTGAFGDQRPKRDRRVEVLISSSR